MKKKQLPIIFGLRKSELSLEELCFFADSNPLGFILFEESLQNKLQTIKLIDSLKLAINNEKLLFLIDQEGGKVKRLNNLGDKYINPNLYLSQACYGDMVKKNGLDYTADLLIRNTANIAKDLKELGINVNCAPVVDILYTYTSDVIGSRSYGSDIEQIIKLATICAETYLDNGIIPVIKHMLGYGRAKLDAHFQLPVVNVPLNILEESDFFIFKKLNQFPCAMITHIVYTCLDKNKPSSISEKCIHYVRDKMLFNGIIFADAIDMQALSNDMVKNTIDTLNAGCDITMYCRGSIDEMQKIVEALKKDKKYVKNNLKVKIEQFIN